MSKKTLIAAVDAFNRYRIPVEGYEGFDRIHGLIEKHDVKFANRSMSLNINVEA